MVTKPIFATIDDTFDRPADTSVYADEDLIANSTTAGDVVPLAFSVSVGNGRGVRITKAKLIKSGIVVTNATFSLYLYAEEPVVVNGDNGALSTDEASFIGQINFPIMTAYTDDASSLIHSGSVSGGFNAIEHYMRTTDTIYGLLKAEAAYTPASAETFTVILTIEQF